MYVCDHVLLVSKVMGIPLNDPNLQISYDLLVLTRHGDLGSPATSSHRRKVLMGFDP